MINIREKLYISTIADDAAQLAKEYGLGLEISEFCTAYNMDEDFEIWDSHVRQQMSDVAKFTFHAPFNELCPAAIDPLILEVAKIRYAQAYKLMREYNINTMIVHAGFVPSVYYGNWFNEKSVIFWKEFLSDKPDDFRLYLENVLEPTPSIICDVASMVNDERFKICLDIGHAVYRGTDISIDNWVAQTLPLLGHVHIHNNYGQRDSPNALGDGILNIDELIRSIVAAAPEITFTIESIDAKSSIQWLIDEGLLA
jgi:sugar phosphate isomerase/epimerase